MSLKPTLIIVEYRLFALLSLNTEEEVSSSESRGFAEVVDKGLGEVRDLSLGHSRN